MRSVAACFVVAGLCTGTARAATTAPLVDAIKQGQPAVIQRLLNQGADVNQRAVDGSSALHWAVRKDDLKTAELLLKRGADVTAANRYGVVPLLLACINGSAPMTELLLRAGADPNGITGEGETMLMAAARTGNTGTISSLLAAGARPNDKERWRGQTAQMWAAAEGHTDVVKILASHGADLRLRSNRGFTAFLFAVREGHIETTRALLALGADVNDALPPLQTGQERPSTDFYVSAPVEGSASALILAVMSAHFELAAALLDAGADPNADGLGYTALHLISWVRKPGSGANFPGPVGSGSMDSLTLVRRLAAAGADLDARMTKVPRNGPQRFQSLLNWNGATPFLAAARSVDAPLMRLLAELGANPLLPNADNTQPLLVAAGIGVRSAGEDPGTEAEVLEAVRVAIELGGDVNSVDKNGETVMHGAAVRGLGSLIQWLAEKGARIEVWNQPNSRGFTPLKLAQGHPRSSDGSLISALQVVPVFEKLIANGAGR